MGVGTADVKCLSKNDQPGQMRRAEGAGTDPLASLAFDSMYLKVVPQAISKLEVINQITGLFPRLNSMAASENGTNLVPENQEGK